MSKMTTIFSHSRFPFPRYYPVSSHGLPLWEDILKRKIKRETRSVTCPRSLSCEMHSNPELCEQLHRGTLAGGWYSATLLPIMTDIAPSPPSNTTLLLYVCREARRFTAESSVQSSIPTTANRTGPVCVWVTGAGTAQHDHASLVQRVSGKSDICPIS